MQIRELLLTELEVIYELVEELEYSRTYTEFEDIIYDMRHQEYKMYGLFECDMLVCFVGVTLTTSLYYGKYLSLNDIAVLKLKNADYFITEILYYLLDYMKIVQVNKIILSSPTTKEIQSIMINRFDFKIDEMGLLSKEIR